MKDETGQIATEELVWMKPKTYPLLLEHSSECKKAKGVSKNVVEKITYSEYKDVLLNKKWLRHLMNRIQSENHKVGAYKINKISLSYFDDKTYIS